MIKLYVTGVFKETLEAQGLEYSRFMTNAMPLNIALWHGIVENERGFWLGQYSIFDADKNVDFQYMPKNKHLLAPYEDAWEVGKLRWITEGFMTVEQREKSLKINDLRFGLSDGGLIEGDEFVFAYILHPKTFSTTDETVVVTRAPGGRSNVGEVLSRVWTRIWGEKRRTPLQIAHKYFQALNGKNQESLNPFLAPQIETHGRASLKNSIFQADSIDGANVIFDVTQAKVENDWAVVHWRKISGEFQLNANLSTGVDSILVRDEKIVEIRRVYGF